MQNVVTDHQIRLLVSVQQYGGSIMQRFHSSRNFLTGKCYVSSLVNLCNDHILLEISELGNLCIISLQLRNICNYQRIIVVFKEHSRKLKDMVQLPSRHSRMMASCRYSFHLPLQHGILKKKFFQDNCKYCVCLWIVKLGCILSSKSKL